MPSEWPAGTGLFGDFSSEVRSLDHKPCQLFSLTSTKGHRNPKAF